MQDRYWFGTVGSYSMNVFTRDVISNSDIASILLCYGVLTRLKYCCMNIDYNLYIVFLILYVNVLQIFTFVNQLC